MKMGKIERITINKAVYSFVEWIWRLCVSFILIIMGVIFIPQLSCCKVVKVLFAIAICVMGLAIGYYSLFYQIKSLDSIKEDNK